MSAAIATPPSSDITSIIPKKGSRARPLFDPPIVKRAMTDSFVKLNPRPMMKNPVMFVVEVGAAMTTVLAIRDQVAPPTVNHDIPDPECDLDYVPNQARPMKIDYALSNSFGFGGTNGCLIFKRYAE